MLIPLTSFVPLLQWDCSTTLDALKTYINPNAVSDDPPQIDQLEYGDLDNAATSANDAFANDPLTNYLSDTPDARAPRSIEKKMLKLAWQWNLTTAVQTKLAFTINHGDSVVIGSPAPVDSPKPSPRQRFYDILTGVLTFIYGKLGSQEQQKRNKELKVRFDALIENALGERAKEMVYINLLATSPACQGRGYGSALVKAIADYADEMGRDAYLISSNINNTFFYNSCGFVSIAETHFGEGNPTWDKKPVVVPLMVREANAKSKNEKAATLV